MIDHDGKIINSGNPLQEKLTQALQRISELEGVNKILREIWKEDCDSYTNYLRYEERGIVCADEDDDKLLDELIAEKLLEQPKSGS